MGIPLFPIPNVLLPGHHLTQIEGTDTMNFILYRAAQLLVLTLGLTLSAMPVGAQQALRSVTLVRAEKMPPGHIAMVYRFGDQRHPVVALAPGAQAADLYDALLLLHQSDTGLTIDSQKTAAIGSRPGQPAKRDNRRLLLYGSFLQELDKSQRRDVGVFRSVKAHDVKVRIEKAKEPKDRSSS